MSHRIAQIESTLQRAISEVLQRRIADPRISGLVSVTRVQVSPDLHVAYVYVSVLPESQQKKVVSGLRHAAGHVQSLVRKAVHMRQVPHLEFRLDEGIKKEGEIYHAIRRGMDRTGPDEAEPDSADGAEGEPPEGEPQTGDAESPPSTESSNESESPRHPPERPPDRDTGSSS